jgi:ankyrin repeat protein
LPERGNYRLRLASLHIRSVLAVAYSDFGRAANPLTEHQEPQLRVLSESGAAFPQMTGTDSPEDFGSSVSNSDDCIAALIQMSQHHDRPENDSAWEAAMPALAREMVALSFRSPAQRDAVLAEASSRLSAGDNLAETDPHYGRTVLHWVALMGNATITDFVLRRGGAALIEHTDFDGNTPLALVAWLRVAKRGIVRPIATVEVVDVLIQHGAQLLSLPDRGCELLYMAGLTPELAQRLVAIGVPVDGKGKEPDTPMLRACWRGNWSLAAAFVELGANVQVYGRWRGTALHMVQLPEALARRLLEKGARPNARDLTGQTPLMVCCETGDLALARLLLDYGASPDARDHAGMTVLDRAREAGGALEQLIREALMLQPALKLASE